MLNPELIILDGVLEASDLLLPRIERWATSYTLADALDGVRIVASRFTTRSRIKGAPCASSMRPVAEPHARREVAR